MNCRKVQDSLVDFLEKNISEDVQREIKNHLSSCEVCQMELADFNKLWESLGNYPVPKVSSNFTSSVMDKVHSLPQTKKPKEKTMKKPNSWYFIYTLAASLAFVIGLYVFNFRDPNHQTISITTNPYSPLTTEEKNIIDNIEIYENLELFQNLELLSDFEVVNSLDDSLQENKHENNL